MMGDVPMPTRMRETTKTGRYVDSEWLTCVSVAPPHDDVLLTTVHRLSTRSWSLGRYAGVVNWGAKNATQPRQIASRPTDVARGRWILNRTHAPCSHVSAWPWPYVFWHCSHHWYAQHDHSYVHSHVRLHFAAITSVNERNYCSPRLHVHWLKKYHRARYSNMTRCKRQRRKLLSLSHRHNHQLYLYQNMRIIFFIFHFIM